MSRSGADEIREGRPTRSLVVLGGADGAITTLETARRIGLHTICVDQRTDVPAIGHADEFLNVSTRDADRLTRLLADRADVAGVLSPASDVNLPTQRTLAERLGLPCGVSKAALRASVDKGFFRAMCDRLGLPGPRHVQGSPGQVRAAAAGLPFPVIVKPTDSSGGRGITLCHAVGELAEAVRRAAAASPSGVVIAESYLAGTHHSAEAVVQDGRIVLFDLGSRVMTPPPHFVTLTHTMPGGSPAVADQVRAMLNRVCQDMAYRWGSLNVDVLVTPDDQVVLVELGARIGGNGSAELLGLAHGVDVTEVAVRMAVGERPPLAPRHRAHAAFSALCAERAGKLVAIHGLAAARALPHVIDVVLAASAGDHVEPYDRAGAKVGYVLVAAPDQTRLRATLDRVDALVRLDIIDPAEATARPAEATARPAQPTTDPARPRPGPGPESAR
ncbi:ATP-grasp domain-containing protein [Plantactinospora sp. GCM10030261]|uniref:ATP-binding protein n=1 Tax=Plantactinospora sp. GCM10030261 TaxID=3273420 RepID=UPI00361E8C50